MPLQDIVLNTPYVFKGVPTAAGLIPKGTAGHLYRAIRFVKDVPSYQKKVLVECLSGPDRDKWFVVSEYNFKLRYREPEEGEVQKLLPEVQQQGDCNEP